MIADFVDEYRSGRTPNPCLRCNESIKFAAVLDRALAMDFDAVATGHYARIVDGPAGPELHRAVDPAKDQSYVLGVLTAEQLAHSAFPLGDDVKEAVRDEAERRGLLVARKPDSHDICFIPDGDTAAFLRSRWARLPATSSTRRRGRSSRGTTVRYAFTIGQRRGLNLRVPAEDGAPRYVVDVDVVDAAPCASGPPELLDVDVIEGIRVVWAGPAVGTEPVRVHAQVRAHGMPVPRARPAWTATGSSSTWTSPSAASRAGQAVVALRRHPRHRLRHRGRHASRDRPPGPLA